MFLAGQSLSQYWTLQKINKTRGDITTSKCHYTFTFYFIPHLGMLEWTSFEKCLFFNAVLYFSRSQAKMGILEFSDNVQL